MMSLLTYYTNYNRLYPFLEHEKKLCLENTQILKKLYVFLFYDFISINLCAKKFVYSIMFCHGLVGIRFWLWYKFFSPTQYSSNYRNHDSFSWLFVSRCLIFSFLNKYSMLFYLFLLTTSNNLFPCTWFKINIVWCKISFCDPYFSFFLL